MACYLLHFHLIQNCCNDRKVKKKKKGLRKKGKRFLSNGWYCSFAYQRGWDTSSTGSEPQPSSFWFFLHALSIGFASSHTGWYLTFRGYFTFLFFRIIEILPFFSSSHTRSAFSFQSLRQIWLSKFWKCQHCGLSICLPGGRRDCRFVRGPVSLSLKCITYAMETHRDGTGHVTLAVVGWADLQWDEDHEVNVQTDAVLALDVLASAAHLKASLLFVFPAVLTPSPTLSLPFQPSFKLHVFGICHPCCLSPSAVVSPAPTVLYCIDMRIPVLPRGNII